MKREREREREGGREEVKCATHIIECATHSAIILERMTFPRLDDQRDVCRGEEKRVRERERERERG